LARHISTYPTSLVTGALRGTPFITYPAGQSPSVTSTTSSFLEFESRKGAQMMKLSM